MSKESKFETVYDVLNYIQTKLKAPKDKYNSFGKYNYRSKEGILDAVKPYLEETGATLRVDESIIEVSGVPVVEAEAILSFGGEAVSCSSYAGVDVNKKGMDIAQTFGSSSSYAGKYALGNLFLIDDTKDPDATNTHGKGSSDSKDKFSKVKDYVKANPKDLDKVLSSPKNTWLTNKQKEELKSLV